MDSDRITGAGKEFGGGVQSAAGNLTGDDKLKAEGALDQAKGIAENTIGQARDALRDVSENAPRYAEEAYETGRRYASDAYERGSGYVDDGSRVVRAQVHEFPLVSLLVAGAVGYLAALLIHSRD